MICKCYASNPTQTLRKHQCIPLDFHPFLFAFCVRSMCGPANAGYGTGYALQQGETNGKCGHFNNGNGITESDATRYNSPAFTKRCCPPTVIGSTSVGFDCKDLPPGEDCHNRDQCEAGYVCGYSGKCEPPLAAGEPCANPIDGGGQDDVLCGPYGAGYGAGGNGKCGTWDSDSDAANLGLGYTERCCPQTKRGSQTIGFQCHDIPFGGSCTEANQCGNELVCGHNHTCHHPLPAGSPCCDENGGNCQDWLCGPWGAGRGFGWLFSGYDDWSGNGACKIFDTADATTLGPQYTERCCPDTDASAGVVGNECKDLPASITYVAAEQPGGPLVTAASSCYQVDQCNSDSICDLRGEGPVGGVSLGSNRNCISRLVSGDPCCDVDGNNCKDEYCTASDPRKYSHGKCGRWNIHTDPSDTTITGVAVDDHRHTERCCVQTFTGSHTVGEECHDIPEGGSCNEANQCAFGLFCNKAVSPPVCSKKLGDGAPCCEQADGPCHDWCVNALNTTLHNDQ